ncbi:MAG: EF-hand domain-containing protein, partial [Luteimonas sp.]
MTRTALFVAGLLALGSLAESASAAAPAPQTATATTVRSAAPRHSRIDANQDGVIDRNEAAASPRMAERFDAIDKNRDGRITADERPKHEGHDGHGGHPDKDRHGKIAALDSDNDGRLSKQELEGKGKFGERFDAMDANHDGYLVRSELRAYHEKERPQREAERTKHFDAQFGGADLNRDGKLSRVEVQEKMPDAAKNFSWMD